MTVLWAESALLPEGFADAIRLEVDGSGALAAVQIGADPAGAERVQGVVLPGMPNLHSHAFQRAMAGLAERLEPGEASFWTWREVMYRFLERIGPDELRTIAAQLYVEMLEAGYTAVGEFHYLHRQPDGRAYADPAELSFALLDAQRASGIGLTHLPVLYMAGGFGGRPAAAAQRRFVHDPDGFADLLDRLAPRFAEDPDLRLGLAPHSPMPSTPKRRSTFTLPSKRRRCATASSGAARVRSGTCSIRSRSGRAGVSSMPRTWTTPKSRCWRKAAPSPVSAPRRRPIWATACSVSGAT